MWKNFPKEIYVCWGEGVCKFYPEHHNFLLHLRAVGQYHVF